MRPYEELVTAGSDQVKSRCLAITLEEPDTQKSAPLTVHL